MNEMRADKEECMIWKKIKKTKQREQIYQILFSAAQPMSAAEIYQTLLTKNKEAVFAVSTVYRSIQAFEDAGLLLKTTLPDTDTGLYEWNHGGHKHYAICLKCHKRIPLQECPFKEIRLEGEDKDFQITGHKVEIYGYCSHCKKK